MADKSKDTIKVEEEVPVNIEVSTGKTLREHLETGVKYATPSIGVGYSIGRILVFFYPYLEPIQLDIVAVLIGLANLGLIVLFKSGKHP